MKVIVIGSKDHRRAECFDWMDRFPNIEEFDAVILDLTSLDHRVLSDIRHKGKVASMRLPFLNMMATGRNIYCIANDIMYEHRHWPEGQVVTNYHYDCNYDWMPVYPVFLSNAGTSAGELTEDAFRPYFQKVTKWTREIAGLNLPMETQGNLILQQLVKDLGKSFGIRSQEPPRILTLPICENKSGKMIASRISFSKWFPGGIYLLPPTTKCDTNEGVEILLDIILGRQTESKPEWWNGIEVPGISSVQEDIDKKAKEIDKLQQEIGQLDKQRANIEQYRNLLSAQGEELVEIVQRVLSDLGIKTKTTPSGYPVDLIREKELAVEVTGTSDKIDSDTDKIFQIARFKEKESKGEKILLVANTYRRLTPDKRKGKMDFTPPVAEYLKLQSVCAMTGHTLFELWKLSLKEGKEKIAERVLTTNGVLQV